MNNDYFHGSRTGPDGTATEEYADWCRTMRLREELRRNKEEHDAILARTAALEKAASKLLKEKEQNEKSEKKN
jgi:hypothetical protein